MVKANRSGPRFAPLDFFLHTIRSPCGLHQNVRQVFPNHFAPDSGGHLDAIWGRKVLKLLVSQGVICITRVPRCRTLSGGDCREENEVQLLPKTGKKVKVKGANLNF